MSVVTFRIHDIMKFVQREREIEIDRDREIEIERDRETERDRERIAGAMILFITKLKRNASFPTCFINAPGETL